LLRQSSRFDCQLQADASIFNRLHHVDCSGGDFFGALSWALCDFFGALDLQVEHPDPSFSDSLRRANGEVGPQVENPVDVVLLDRCFDLSLELGMSRLSLNKGVSGFVQLGLLAEVVGGSDEECPDNRDAL